MKSLPPLCKYLVEGRDETPRFFIMRRVCEQGKAMDKAGATQILLGPVVQADFRHKAARRLAIYSGFRLSFPGLCSQAEDCRAKQKKAFTLPVLLIQLLAL